MDKRFLTILAVIVLVFGGVIAVTRHSGSSGSSNGSVQPSNHIEGQGKANVTLVNTRVTLDDGDHSVFANGGTALVVHAAKDDMHSDPAGNAGARIACGTITK